ncbi:MAG: hypothetical protein RBR06_03680 [Desulfuromonadaceae bacterium]|nr:hypothetical protein [Desulfuromonadaceae bacterium]
MKKNIWDEREKAFEDKYFHDLEREQLRKLREKNAPRSSGNAGEVTTSDPDLENKDRKK